MSGETIGDQTGDPEYNVDRIDTLQDGNGEINSITVELSGERQSRNPVFEFNVHEGKAFVNNFTGIDGMDVIYIGKMSAVAENAVLEHIDSVNSVSPLIDMINKYAPDSD
ncbi:MAG TPA: hypothetical protein VFJ06_14230 [Halococcus sp.]|nr:hypothetical protein [Halococcus sp.]